MTGLPIQRLIVSTLCGLALVACGSGGAYTMPDFAKAGRTPLDINPIGVREKTEFLEIDLKPNDTRLRQTDEAMIIGFLSIYRKKGHGPVVISLPTDGANPQLAVQISAEVRDLAWEAGVEYGAIIGSTYDAAGDLTAPIVLAFQTYEAIAPDCPTLSAIDVGDVSNNEVLPNFGCAVRRNTAAMIADPGDLLGQRPLGPGDAARRSVVLQAFRDGQATGAERGEAETTTVSTAVGN